MECALCKCVPGSSESMVQCVTLLNMQTCIPNIVFIIYRVGTLPGEGGGWYFRKSMIFTVVLIDAPVGLCNTSTYHRISDKAWQFDVRVLPRAHPIHELVGRHLMHIRDSLKFCTETRSNSTSVHNNYLLLMPVPQIESGAIASSFSVCNTA